MDKAFALLDAPGGGALLFEGLLRTLTVADVGEYAPVCAAVEAALADGVAVVAALDYEMGYLIEPSAGPAPGGALAVFWLFARRTTLAPAALAEWLAEQSGDPPRPAALLDFAPQLDESAYRAAVERIRDYIAAGDCYQVNFTFFFAGRCLGDPLALYARLRRAQPVACGGIVMVPGTTVLSLSPEIFVERHGGRIAARPMKGTAARLGDAVLDARARRDLALSDKDRAENVMIVDLIRNDLGRIAESGSVRVDTLCEVEDYPSLFQMTSSVSATSHADLASVLRALFPCGSITGAPKVRAMQIVRSLEQAPRGLYTGALGWLAAGGEFRFNVAIRTLILDAAGNARLGVGSGIVWDSDPAAEYRECLLKSRFVFAADPGFRLIETLRLSDGDFPLRERHLRRLCASASALAFACDAGAVDRALDSLAADAARGEFRVRLTLGRDGSIETGVSPLSPTPSGQRYVFSRHRLSSEDMWLRHKTTARTRYDAELRRIGANPALFDALFLNERGEVCEGARTNVFVRQVAGGPLLTPPLSCGLLPGVLRGQLLESGAAIEAVLTPGDLARAAEVYLGNALRGLVPVSCAVS